MTLLAPWFLAGGLAAVAALVALHLLAWRRPPATALPTARFVPDAPARARSRATRPVDVALLALRALALLLAALAFARPVRTAPRAPLARVVVVDLSASVARPADAVAAARAALRPGDALVVLRDSARVAEGAGVDSLPAVRGTAPGALSAALVAAADAARLVAARADSAELVLVTPLAREETDAATPALAGRWTGRARLVRVAAAADAAPAVGRVELRGARGDDAVAAAVALLGRAAAPARVARGAATAEDSAWVGGAPGRALVEWPATDGAVRVEGVAWGDDAVVAPLARRELAAPGGARVVARWADGAPAAVERALGGGCVREVGVGVPARGDVALRPGMLRLTRALLGPCGGARDLAPVAPAALGLRETGAALALPRPAERDPWRIARWLLAGAVALLLAEPLLRRDRAIEQAMDEPRAAPEAA